MKIIKTVVVNETCKTVLALDLETAQTGWQRMRGLIGRSGEDFREGMGLWLQGCEGIHTIGMSFPIDAAYLDEDCRVVHMYRGIRPYRIGKIKLNARSVLELPAGTLDKSRTKIGDRLRFVTA